MRRFSWRLLLPSLFLFVSGAVAAAQSIAIEVASAAPAFDQRTNEPIVTFRMTAASQRLFADFTTKNVGKAVEFRVDGRTIMKTVIREPILGGSGQLLGGFTADAARDLAARLSTGSAKMEIEAVQN